jgi:beta-N-acetylhexosaminidase
MALAAAAAAALAAGLVVGSAPDESGPAEPGSAAGPADALTLRRQVGQLLVSSFDGAALPAYLRRRLRAGQTAGVIVFGANAAEPAGWRSLTRAIQRVAGGGALVATDQEGGAIRTLPFAPPELGQPAQGGPRAVRAEARRAGRRLRELGVNVNLAPVADVAVPGSVMAPRAFAGGPAAVAARTRAAVAGLREAGVAATVKHFPGLGAAAVNTDDAPVAVDVPRALIERRELPPFRVAVRERVPLVMLSHALYPAFDRRRIASQSPALASGLLRGELGYRGVAVTDSLEADAVLRRSSVADAAERSIRAGADLLLMTGSASWNVVYPHLLATARRSSGFRRRVRLSAARVLALKDELGLRRP